MQKDMIRDINKLSTNYKIKVREDRDSCFVQIKYLDKIMGFNDVKDNLVYKKIYGSKKIKKREECCCCGSKVWGDYFKKYIITKINSLSEEQKEEQRKIILDKIDIFIHKDIHKLTTEDFNKMYNGLSRIDINREELDKLGL